MTAFKFVLASLLGLFLAAQAFADEPPKNISGDDKEPLTRCYFKNDESGGFNLARIHLLTPDEAYQYAVNHCDEVVTNGGPMRITCPLPIANGRQSSVIVREYSKPEDCRWLHPWSCRTKNYCGPLVVFCDKGTLGLVTFLNVQKVVLQRNPQLCVYMINSP